MKTKLVKKVSNRKYRINQKILFQSKIHSISRIFLSSLLVISFFYVAPLLMNFTEKNILKTKEFSNNSKKILAYTLNKKNNLENENELLNEKELLLDIFSLNDLETDTVRLSAATIKQLFQDTGYI